MIRNVASLAYDRDSCGIHRLHNGNDCSPNLRASQRRSLSYIGFSSFLFPFFYLRGHINGCPARHLLIGGLIYKPIEFAAKLVPQNSDDNQWNEKRKSSRLRGFPTTCNGPIGFPPTHAKTIVAPAPRQRSMLIFFKCNLINPQSFFF